MTKVDLSDVCFLVHVRIDTVARQQNLEIIQEFYRKYADNTQFIFIEDDGPGIPKSEYENVFKPFYKIDKGRGETKSSVGLGLSIASDIIKSHGGNIELGKSRLGGLSAKVSLPF